MLFWFVVFCCLDCLLLADIGCYCLRWLLVYSLLLVVVAFCWFICWFNGLLAFFPVSATCMCCQFSGLKTVTLSLSPTCFHFLKIGHHILLEGLIYISLWGPYLLSLVAFPYQPNKGYDENYMKPYPLILFSLVTNKKKRWTGKAFSPLKTENTIFFPLLSNSQIGSLSFLDFTGI